MKVKIEEIPGRVYSKLACVKRVKEMTGLGLRDAKHLVDGCSEINNIVEFDVSHSRGDIEQMKGEFRTWGYKLSGGRGEALDNLLGDVYMYVVELLHRDITYKIEEGSVERKHDNYVFTIEIGIKVDREVEHSVNGKVITMPFDAVCLEENSL